jgi:phosphoribosylformimino-5-aminoimidazole carboxamide ribotide isomerase
MLIPSIDLRGGRVVQLVQGERLAVEDSDIDRWIERFRGFPKVQVIDLDAAKGAGDNEELVARICSALHCRVGGGVRSVLRAQQMFELGAEAVILGSALFTTDGGVAKDFAATAADALAAERIIAAVDSRAGQVVVDAWRTSLPLTPVEAIRSLEPFAGEFLYTHVEREGLMQGTDMAAIREVRDATLRRVTAAGGITTQAEIDYLDSIGVDAVVGMAIYTGRLHVTRG